MENEIKTVRLRIPVEIAEWIEKRGEGAGINQGVMNVVKSLMAAELHADLMIKGVFLPGEWIAMADCIKRPLGLDEVRFSKEILRIRMHDGERFGKVLDKWSVDPEPFFAKIEALNPVQVEAVFRRIENFWERCNEVNIEEWSKY